MFNRHHLQGFTIDRQSGSSLHEECRNKKDPDSSIWLSLREEQLIYFTSGGTSEEAKI